MVRHFQRDPGNSPGFRNSAWFLQAHDNRWRMDNEKFTLRWFGMHGFLPGGAGGWQAGQGPLGAGDTSWGAGKQVVWVYRDER